MKEVTSRDITSNTQQGHSGTPAERTRDFLNFPTLNSIAMDLKEESNEALFERFLTGDDKALVALFERHNKSLFHYCYKVAKDRKAAEDLTEDMWVSLIEMRDKLKKKEKVLAFLFRILRNRTLNYLKRPSVKRKDSTDKLREMSHDVPLSECSEREEMIIDCLDQLPVRSKELLLLHYYGGYEFTEIAEMMGTTPNALYARATRARHQLQTCIEEKLKNK